MLQQRKEPGQSGRLGRKVRIDRRLTGNRLIRHPFLALIMARSDSVLFFLAGFTQLLIGSELAAIDPTLAILGAVLEVTGGSSVLVGIYLLIFVARHHKEFTESYNKLEKATMARGNSGRLQRVDPLPVKRRITNVVIPGILAFIAAMAWLAN